MACHFHGSVFCHLPAWKLLSMGALSPRRRRCSSALQSVYRVLAAAFFEGVLLWLAVQSDPLPAPLFAHFFWQDRRNQIANQRSVCNLERTSNGTDETCRLRRGEGCGVCEDEGLRSNSCSLIENSAPPVNSDKRADVHPQGVGRIRSAPSSLTAALAIGPYKVPCRIVCEAVAAAPPQIRGVSSA